MTAGMTPIKHIDICVESKDGDTIISVENDGDGIPIEMNEEEKVMVPQLIFGQLLTSSNYDKSEEKIVGGKNGYGAKAVNILSKLFTVDIKTPASQKQYTQSWYNNMFQVEKPIIKKSTSKTGHVKITFIPDKTRFQGAFDADGAIPDMIAVFHTRTVELAALVGKEVKVTWNGTVVGSNTFEKYIKLFLRDGMTGFAYEQCGARWEVGAILASHLYSDEEELAEEKHISFVNGINTKKGGKHVESVTRKLLTDFCEFAKKKKVEIKPGQLKNSVVLFLNSTIVNPSFDSQSKEFLTTPAAEFGSRPEFSGKLVDSLFKLGLLDEAKHVLEAK
jgi:DNA topoisomerase-2